MKIKNLFKPLLMTLFMITVLHGSVVSQTEESDNVIWIFKPEYSLINEEKKFSEGMLRIKKDNKLGYIGTTGKVIEPQFDDILFFFTGKFPTQNFTKSKNFKHKRSFSG